MVAYEPPATASAAHKAFAEYINAFDAFDAERLFATFDDDDFTFTLLPKAMAGPSYEQGPVQGLLLRVCPAHVRWYVCEYYSIFQLVL